MHLTNVRRMSVLGIDHSHDSKHEVCSVFFVFHTVEGKNDEYDVKNRYTNNYETDMTSNKCLLCFLSEQRM